MLHAPTTEYTKESGVKGKPSGPTQYRSAPRTLVPGHQVAAPRPQGLGLRPSQGGLLRRKCACGGTPGPTGECAGCRAERLGLQRRSADQAENSEAPPIVHEVLRSPGQPLDPATRAFMEPRFGRDFSQVRVHTDARAAESAQAVNALAYTVGRDVVFGVGQYAPGTTKGRRLLAHELTHVVQQDQASSHLSTMGQRNDMHEQAARAAATIASTTLELAGLSLNAMSGKLKGSTGSVPALQREEQTSDADTRVDDPSFLLCLILCYLGIPPALWKTAVELFLRAVWEEYRGTYAQAQAEADFRSYREEFRVYGAAKVIKLVLTFAVQGKIGFIPIRTAAARALQTRITEFLIARGATAAGLAVAEQVARKIAIAVEVAFVAGCATYCGGIAYFNALNEATTAVIEGIAATTNIVSGIVQGAVVGLLVLPLLIARATVDPANWNLSPLPASARADIYALGWYLWMHLEPDNADRFLANIGRLLSTYPIPPVLIQDIADAMTKIASSRTGFNIVFTPELILQMTPLTFVQLLKDWRLLEYRQDPERVADAALYGQEAP